MDALKMAIQLSVLFEKTGSEGSEAARLIDAEIVPHMSSLLAEADGIGLGQRFSKVLDQVRLIVDQSGGDIRGLKQMMQGVLTNYVKRTHDALTGRHIFHNAIMQGKDEMLTVTAAGLLSNALAGQHPRQAMQLMQQVGNRLTGERGVHENASGAAVGAGAIATAPIGSKADLKARKRRKDSIFAEADVLSHARFQRPPVDNPNRETADMSDIDTIIPAPKRDHDHEVDHTKNRHAESLSWNDLLDSYPTIELLREVASSATNRMIGGVLVDPTTAELVLATHTALSPDRRRRYESKNISEMIRIANRLFETGGIEIVVEEG